MKAADRAVRDEKVVRAFVAGLSFREIARAVGLRSPGSVHAIVHRELGREGARHALLSDRASAVLTERTEALWRAHFPAAMQRDYRSSAICVRLLDVAARAVAVGPPSSGDPGDAAEEPDALAEWRQRRTVTGQR